MTTPEQPEAYDEDDFTLSPFGRDEVDFPENMIQPAVYTGADEMVVDGRSFEDLTLAEVLGLLFKAPRPTLRALVALTTASDGGARQWRSAVERTPLVPPLTQQAAATPRQAAAEAEPIAPAMKVRFGLWMLAFVIAWWGNSILASNPLNRNEMQELRRGAPFLLAAFVIWIGAEIYANWPAIRAWWKSRREVAERAQSVPSAPLINVQDIQQLPILRLSFLGGGALFMVLTWIGTSNNRFTFTGFWSWMFSIVLITAALAPEGWTLSNGWRGLQEGVSRIRLRNNATFFALVAIVALGAVFRFSDLAGVPPEMTSDHVEKILDAQRVVQGTYNVFFANNGGREPFQMYAMALLSQVPGLGMNFETLKILAILEGLLTLPILWLLGREIIGEHDRRLGNAVGLVLAALVAASYWHTAITRLSLRIVLTPLVASLLLIYLSRAMRHNRRGDFIVAGLILGFGLYTYQAVRMLPVVVVVGVGMAFVFHARNLRDRARYAIHLGALVLVAFTVFVPLMRYWDQYPESFWMRTSGRLLGDDVIQEEDAAGNIVMRNATIEDRLDAFERNLPVLGNNLRNALLMYNWKGDVAWINGAPNYPAMDIFTGALLIIGLAAWTVWMVRTRDVVIVLIPVMLLIMLLPSALSIAYPIENPSATRTSGSLPSAYLMAALPLALLAVELRRVLPRQMALTPAIPVALVVAVVLGAYVANSNLYFGRYRESYELSSLPYSEPGRILRGFALSDGSYGNAFVIAYPYWWDHRAVGMEGGILDWPNGIVTREQVPDFVYDVWQCGDNRYRLDPERDLLFFYNPRDTETADLLSVWFREGRAIRYPSYQLGDDFMFYRVPALGVEGMEEFTNRYTTERRC